MSRRRPHQKNRCGSPRSRAPGPSILIWHREYGASTPFITLEGGDLMAVLDERIPLDELLRRKKRHANETGECYFPASRML